MPENNDSQQDAIQKVCWHEKLFCSIHVYIFMTLQTMCLLRCGVWTIMEIHSLNEIVYLRCAMIKIFI